jgi:hypothetical protein
VIAGTHLSAFVLVPIPAPLLWIRACADEPVGRSELGSVSDMSTFRTTGLSANWNYQCMVVQPAEVIYCLLARTRTVLKKEGNAEVECPNAVECE